MGTGQRNETAALRAGHGQLHVQLRASHADRDQAVDLLKAAFVDGRLTTDELDVRVGEALAAKTCGQLAALTTDIHAASTQAEPLPEPARARTRSATGKARTSGSGAVIAACVAAVTVLAVAGAHLRPGPDAVACQSFSVWAQQGNAGFNTTMWLDFSVAAASHGPDHGLTRDLQALRQAVLQNESQNRVDAATAQVDAACIPYNN